jgi:transposase
MGKLDISNDYHRKLQFWNLVYDIKANLKPAQICEKLGISKATYYRWMNEPSAAKEAVLLQGNLVAERTRQAAYQHRAEVIDTLLDVMTKSRNDLARVRAAEIMFEIGEDARREEGAVTEDKSELADLLQNRASTIINNTLIVNNNNVLERRGTGEYAAEVIDATAKLLPVEKE